MVLLLEATNQVEVILHLDLQMTMLHQWYFQPLKVRHLSQWNLA